MGDLDRATACKAGEKREIGVWEILCWAFQQECVSLDLDEQRTGLQSKVGVDPIFRMVEIARLGCRVQGGGVSQSHHDAEIVAGTLAVLPDNCGGSRMATWIADLARSGRQPDWQSAPSIVPVETRTNRWGVRAVTADAQDLGSEGWPHQPRRNKKQRIVYDPVLYSPCLIRPSPSQVARFRREYLAWYGALLEIRIALQTTHLTSHVVSKRMPPRAPWAKTT